MLSLGDGVGKLVDGVGAEVESTEDTVGNIAGDVGDDLGGRRLHGAPFQSHMDRPYMRCV